MRGLLLLLVHLAHASTADDIQWLQDATLPKQPGLFDLTDLALNPDEWDYVRFDPKLFQYTNRSSFVLYTAPVCSHCAAAEQAFRTLAEEFASASTLFALVNCTTVRRKTRRGIAHLETQNITKFPALRYFNPPWQRGHSKVLIGRTVNRTVVSRPHFKEYKGSRKLKALRAFAATLRPVCLPTTFDKFCSDEEQAAMLAPLLAQSVAALGAQLAATKKKLEAKQQEVPRLEDRRMKAMGGLSNEDPDEVDARKIEAENEVLRLEGEVNLFERAIGTSGARAKDEF